MTSGQPAYEVLVGDVLEVLRALPPWHVDLVTTSFPFWQKRDYGVPPTRWGDGCEVAWGLEPDWRHFVDHCVEVCRELDRVVRRTGSVYIELGDSYAGSGNGSNDRRATDGLGNPIAGRYGTHKPGQVAGIQRKSRLGIPYRLYIRLVDELQWVWRSDSRSRRTNGMPPTTRDRWWDKCTPFSYFTLDSDAYFFDVRAVLQPYAKSTRSTWTRTRSGADREPSFPGHPPKAFLRGKPGRLNGVIPEDIFSAPTGKRRRDPDHNATYDPSLVEPLILASCPPGGLVLDPCSGTGSTGEAALLHGRRYLGIEANPVIAARSIEHLSSVPFAARLAA